MAIPPLLQEHVKALEQRGFVIEVIIEQEIYIIFKDYPIPDHIWNRGKADLLVVAHKTYPNAKMDMFWIDPPISLKNGNDAQGINCDSKCGRTWQCFSWHVKSWNPAHDNLITYLDVIDGRLKENV